MQHIFFFDVNLKWEEGTLGEIASTKVNHTLKVGTSQVISKEISAKWTPEHLFLGSICSSYMSTFIEMAELAELKFISFGCDALGRVEMVDDVLNFTEIILKTVLKLYTDEDMEKANRVLEKAANNCLIVNSLKLDIQRFSQISIAEEKVEAEKKE
jgi:organic hydroperoxide reductase OsmC/OhrA